MRGIGRRVRAFRAVVSVLITVSLIIGNVPLRLSVDLARFGPYSALPRAVGDVAYAVAESGLSWVSRTTPANNDWISVAWSPQLGLFAAVAFAGTANRVMTSPDGVNWTLRTSPGNNWYGVAWSPALGLFAAVAGSGAGNRVMTSSDGITWTSRPSPADNFWRAIAWSPELGLFAAVSTDGANRVMTSPDGVTWTLRPATATVQWRAITWSPALGLFAAVGLPSANNAVMTSPDGVTWTTRTTDNDSWLGIAWSPELELFAAVVGSGIKTSPDGITWTLRSVPVQNTWFSIAWSAELGLFAVGAMNGTGTKIMTSPDGLNWTLNATPSDNQWLAIAWSAQLGLFAAVAATGTGNRAMTSVASQTSDFGSDKPHAFGAQAYGAFSADPVNLGTGSLTVRAADLSLPGRVLGVDFTRWYNSADLTIGPMGPAWTHSYEWTLTNRAATVELHRGDGRRDTFTRQADGSYAPPLGVFDTLTRNADGSFVLLLANQTRFAFGTTGALLSISEPAGNQITFAYTGTKLTTVTDTVGRQLALSYNAQNRLIQIQDPLGRKVTYAYDSGGRLVTVTDRIGNGSGPATAHQWKYAYDGSTRHIRTITDQDGRVLVTNAYDPQGRIVEQRDGLNALTTIAYTSGQAVVTDPRGHSTTYTFDARAQVLTQVDVVGASTYTLAFEYDTAGNRTRVTDRQGKATDLAYDTRGNLLTKTDPSPDGIAARPITSFAYDAKNNLVQIVDALGAVTDLSYDAGTNVLLSTTRQIDATTTAKTTFEYGDPANPGLPTRIVAPRGNIAATPDPTFSATMAYDARANLIRRVDADGAVTTYAYDSVGRLTSFVDPDGHALGGVAALQTWRVAYDENDRETSRTDPLGGSQRAEYDGAGNRITSIDRNDNVTSYSYDANSRLLAVRQRPAPGSSPALVYTTSIGRDANGNATRVTQANGVITDYAFDALNRLVAVTSHPTTSTSLVTNYVLDGNGQPLTRTTADGVTVAYTYDGLARLTAVSGPSLTVAYSYDAGGRRSSMTDATGSTTYQYDRLGRPTQITAPAGTLSYAYDRDGNRTQITYPGGDAVAYGYSPGGRLQSVTDWAARTSTYTYRASGLVATTSYPNGHRTEYAYDQAQRLTRIETKDALGVLAFSQAYVLDAEGNRLRRADAAILDLAATTTVHTYDGLSRLLSSDRTTTALSQPLTSESFTLDAASNLAARSGPAATYTYDGANRLTGDGSQTFTFDAADRLVQRGADTFTYDPLARLVSATIGATSVAYAYNGDGLLHSRTANSIATTNLWDPTVAIATLLKAGDERVVHGLGPLYRVLSNGTTRMFVRDALGSVRAEISDSGVITSAHDYVSYGELRAGPTFSTPALLGFAGELRDSETGLIYLRARWYDPASGRFLSSDPVAGEAANPSTLNGYAYGYGNPASYTDPSGKCGAMIGICLGVLVGATVSLAGYAISVASTPGANWDWGMAALTTVTGAVAGGICGSTFGAGCFVANGAGGALQYLAAPGNKSVTGLGVSLAASALLPQSRFLRHVPYLWDARMVRFNRGHLSWWQRNAVHVSAAVTTNLPRAFVANTVSSFEATAAGAQGDGAAGEHK